MAARTAGNFSIGKPASVRKGSASSTDRTAWSFPATAKGAIPPYDAMVLISPKRAGDKRLLKALAPLGMTVQEFPPGTCYDSETGFHTYYVVPDRAPMDLALAQHVGRVREAVEAAVEKRLLSDVPLGAFLKGHGPTPSADAAALSARKGSMTSRCTAAPRSSRCATWLLARPVNSSSFSIRLF